MISERFEHDEKNVHGGATALADALGSPWRAACRVGVRARVR